MLSDARLQDMIPRKPSRHLVSAVIGEQLNTTACCFVKLFVIYDSSMGISILRKYVLDPLVASGSPPWYDARGIGIGLFIGFAMPLGLQMVILGVFRAVCPFNAVMAFAFTWVNNPLSVVPMYYGYYYFGSLLLHKPATLSAADFRQLMMPVTTAEYFWDSLRHFALLGMDFFIRWGVAAAVIGVAMGCLGYLAGYYIQREHCRRKAERLGVTYEQLLGQLNEEIATRKKESQWRQKKR